MKRFHSMVEQEFVSKLTAEIETLKQRVVKHSEVVERCTGDKLFAEKATLRNLVVQLEGLKLMLLRMQQQQFGG